MAVRRPANSTHLPAYPSIPWVHLGAEEFSDDSALHLRTDTRPLEPSILPGRCHADRSDRVAGAMHLSCSSVLCVHAEDTGWTVESAELRIYGVCLNIADARIKLASLLACNRTLHHPMTPFFVIALDGFDQRS